MKLYEELKRQTSGEKVYCLNCGALNDASQDECENCQAALQRPASLWRNMFETVTNPMKAMFRIAATTPVMQAFLVVLLMGSISLLIGVMVALNELNYYLADLNTHLTDTQKKAFQDARSTPEIGFDVFLNNLFWTFIPWFAFAIALFYAVRIFYRKDARVSFTGLLSVVGFARISAIGSLVFLVLPVKGDDITQTISSFLSLGVLAWQLALLTIGVKFSTGLTFNRALLVVMIPALLFRFLLGLPF